MATFDEILRAAGDSNGVGNNTPLSLASVNPSIANEESYVYNTTAYKKFEIFIDENFATLTTDKMVNMSGVHTNISEEQRSQIIPFQLPRYSEGVDLADKNFMILYENANGNHGYSVPINFRYNESYIRFYWLVDAYATVRAGTLKFQILAIGSIYDVSGASYEFRWSSKVNNSLVVTEGLRLNTAEVEADKSYIDSAINTLNERIDAVADILGDAESIRSDVNDLAAEIGTTKEEITQDITNNITATLGDLIETEMEPYLLKTDAETIVYEADHGAKSYQLKVYKGNTLDRTYDLQTNPTDTWETAFRTAIGGDISTAISALYTNAQIDAMLGGKVNTADLTTLSGRVETLEGKLGEGSEFYTKSEVNDLLDTKAPLSVSTTASNALSKATANETSITNMSQVISQYKQYVDELRNASGNQEENVKYYITYSDGDNLEEAQKYWLTLWKYTDDEAAFDQNGQFKEVVDSQENPTTISLVKSVRIVGGGGGGGSSSSTTMSVRYISPNVSSVTKLYGSQVVLTYYYDSVDSSEQHYGGLATWRIGNRVIGTQTVSPMTNIDFDVTSYLTSGSTTRFTLTIEDDTLNTITRNWTIKTVSIRLESNFDDTITRPVNNPVQFTYIPYGDVSKTVHFKLDGTELESNVTSGYNLTETKELPAQTHGAHYLEAWITADVDGTPIVTDSIFKDIIWYNSEMDQVPVIGISNHDVSATQYSTVKIRYSVYDPTTENPRLKIYVGDSLVSEQTVSNGAGEWTYKATEIGTRTIRFDCTNDNGTASRTVTLTTTAVQINVPHVSINPEFEFSPEGLSNTSVNRLWTDGTYSMTVSQNFDWTTGGYKVDSDGDTYFCVKAGTTATFDYKPFGVTVSGDSVLTNGKEFKIIYKVTNVRDADTTWMRCISGSQKQGLVGYAHNIVLSSNTADLNFPLSEDDVIEFEYKINRSTGTNPLTLAMGYEDGTPLRARLYSVEEDNYDQINPASITFGSTDCDVHIYKIRAYESDLTDSEVLTNFITDARNTEELIARFNRNQIYDTSGNLTPEVLSNACPDLRILELTVDRFTRNKKDYVHLQEAKCYYKNGDPTLDNWTFKNGYLSGQGTTSDNYGAAGRNLDIIFAADGEHQIISKIGFEAGYATELYLGLTDDNEIAAATPIINGQEIDNGDGTTTVQETKVSLTRTSVPNNWFNIKVNIASSENANNALLQNRYNTYLPYSTLAQERDPYAKNAMEFQNCVVFVREANTDLSTHTEFNDTSLHFYGIGNIGDSKKTDATRACDPTDINEFVIEVSDNDQDNQRFYTGVYNQDGSMKYPIDPSEWVPGNSAYDSLYNDWDNSFEFRYELGGDVKDGMGDITDETATAQELTNKQIWRDFYTWVVTSTDEEFKAELGDKMIIESPLFWYLFTERFIMIDNRAKNSFWRYAKCPDGQYRFELLDYDNDTALGINNQGELAMPYGTEDIDYRTDGSDWAFNAGDSVFWRRIRKLFDTELRTLYQRSTLTDCWRSTSVINQFDDWQSQFPEELWRLDYERKYLRPYLEGGSSGYLTDMMNGRKKYQRRQWERDQDAYTGSKYLVSYVTSDNINFRCNSPSDVVVSPNYDLDIVPYSDMYIGVMYGNASGENSVIRTRAKAGIHYTIESTLTSASNTQVTIYNAGRIQEINGLSTCYIGQNDFAKATRLKKLEIGSSTEGYANSYITTLGLGNNGLLEELDVRNLPNLTSVPLTGCPSLSKFYAEGTSLAAAAFANGGRISIAHLPAITSLKLYNLPDLTDEGLVVSSYENLTDLVVENCPNINSRAIIIAAVNLERLRATGISWTINESNADKWLESLIDLYGFNASGGNSDKSVLAGYVYLPASDTFTQSRFTAAWPDLEVEIASVLNAWKVTYMNPPIDPEDKVLWETYVIEGRDAPDPVLTGEIDTPTMVVYMEDGRTIALDYIFNGSWSTDGETPSATALASVGYGGRTVYACYDTTPHMYTIKFVNKDGSILQSSTAEYGSSVEYTGSTPTYTLQEAANDYFLFKGWKTYPIVTGDLTVEPDYDEYHYSREALSVVPLSDMRPVQIYAMLKHRVGNAMPFSISFGDTVSWKMGNDFNYSNVETNELISSETNYTYNSNTRTGNFTNTGVELIDGDRDWILVADYYFDASSTPTADLISCYQSVGLGLSGAAGIRLTYMSDGLKLYWGNNSISVPTSLGTRDIIVLRHKKGSDLLHVYCGNLPRGDIYYTSISTAYPYVPETAVRGKKLIFGANLGDDGATVQYYATGKIYSAKLFYTDIGDAACRAMAMWCRETVTASFRREFAYYLADNSGSTAAMTFIADHLLTNEMAGFNGANNGGWFNSAVCSMQPILEERFYNAIPIEWRQLIKEVIVSANAGRTSEQTTLDNVEVVASTCHVTVPAAIELAGVGNLDYRPYNLEAGNSAQGLGYSASGINTNSDRVRLYPDGSRGEYMTRTAGPMSTNTWWIVYGDIDTSSYYTPGELDNRWSSGGNTGALIEFSI